MGSEPLVIADAGTRATIARSLLALTVVTAIRLAVAATAPLSPDEAYYWVWSRALAPGYLDHPPMVALWIRAGTAMLGQTSLGLRLLAPLSAAAGSILLAAAGNRLFPARKPGIWAAILLNATLMVGTGSVTMTPDTPLLFFWTACLYALARIASGGPPGWWIAVGAAAGLGLDSKYTAALLGLGIALWLLTPRMRPALRTPWPWAGGALALLLTAPVIQWNAAHGWISIVKQGGRTADWHPALRYLLELAAGQFGLATPVIAVLMAQGAARAARHWRDPAPALLAALILPGAAVFLQHAIGDRVQANWVAILYPAAALAAAAYAPRGRASRGLVWGGRVWGGRVWGGRVWGGRTWGAGLGFALTSLLYLQASLAPFPLPRPLDPTLRLAGFAALASAAAQTAATTTAATSLAAGQNTPLASEEYGLAALLAWYGPLPTVGNEPRWRSVDLPAAPPGPMLLVLSARHPNGPDPALWQSAIPAGTLERTRRGIVAETYRLYRVIPRPGSPAVLLPNRPQ